MIILVLTGSIAGTAPTSPMLGVLAPILVLTFMTWYLVLLVVNRNEIITALAAILLLRGKEKPAKANLLITIMAYAFFVCVTIVFLWSGLPQRILGGFQGINVTSGTGDRLSPPPQINSISNLFPTTPIIYYAISVFAAIFVLSLLLLLRGLQMAFQNRGAISEGPETETELKQEAAQAVHRAIASLKVTRQYHEAILQCYRRMCEILSEAGVVIDPAETAREFAESISVKLQVGKDAVRGLTFLFEEARYSDHQITEQKRIMALDHLESLEKVLSANVGLNV